MSDILNIIAKVESIALEQTKNGKEKYSLKLEGRFYSIWRYKTKPNEAGEQVETKAWKLVKEKGSDNLMGETYQFAYTEYHPEGAKYPYKTIIGFERPSEADALMAQGNSRVEQKYQPSSTSNTPVQFNTANLEERVKALENKVFGKPAEEITLEDINF
jgi:hypothetical protein